MAVVPSHTWLSSLHASTCVQRPTRRKTKEATNNLAEVAKTPQIGGSPRYDRYSEYPQFIISSKKVQIMPYWSNCMLNSWPPTWKAITTLVHSPSGHMVSASCQVLLTSCAYVGLGFCLSAVETRKEFVMSVVSTRVPVLHLDVGASGPPCGPSAWILQS